MHVGTRHRKPKVWVRTFGVFYGNNLDQPGVFRLNQQLVTRCKVWNCLVFIVRFHVDFDSGTKNRHVGTDASKFYLVRSLPLSAACDGIRWNVLTFSMGRDAYLYEITSQSSGESGLYLVLLEP